ncbi:MAG TPA: hypothetical protein EYP67_08030 [Methanosarcinales archaeon]|nr:hypothetical protein [Methanosarcinales archaeon]
MKLDGGNRQDQINIAVNMCVCACMLLLSLAPVCTAAYTDIAESRQNSDRPTAHFLGGASRDIGKNVYAQNNSKYNIKLSEAKVLSLSTSSSAFVQPEPAGDLNGDGTDDLLIGFGSYNASMNLLLDEIDAVSGDDGSVLWSRKHDENRWIYAIRAGNLGGDGMDDVLLLTRGYDSGTDTYPLDSISALNGEDGAVLWSENVNKDQWIMWTEFDFSGDGIDDMMVYHSSYESSIDHDCIDTIYILEGDDGSLLWQTNPGNWIDAYPAGDLDGDGAEDLLVYVEQNLSTHWTAEIYAVRGSDGGTLWSKTASNNDHVWIYPASPAGDLNDDGRSDVMMRHESYDPSTHNYTTTIYALHGKSGSTIWSDASTAPASFMDVYPADDLDGDGKDDLLLYPREYDPANYRWYVDTVYAKRGYDNRQLWTKTGTNMGFMRASDLNGDGADDLLFGEFIYDVPTDMYFITDISAARGQDSSFIWTKTRSGTNFIYALPAGDLNGDGAVDVVVYDENYSSYDPDLDEIYVDIISAVKGSDGSVLWNKSSQEKRWIDAWYVGYTGDFDGDGADDVLVCTYIYNSPGDRYILTIISAVRGDDGRILWSKSALRGDLDSDGNISYTDAMLALQIAVSGEYEPAADVSNDGYVTSLDALMILHAAVEGTGI